MIIKSHGIRTGTAERVVSYVQAQGGNEQVEVLENASEALMDADLFAGSAGHKNSVLHITISPDQEISRDELRRVTAAINVEFGFFPDDPMLMVRHVSNRKNGARLSHFHLIRPAADAGGKVYDLYRSKKKDETISRFLEIELGHQITAGKHSDFVHERFIERGLTRHAEQIARLVNVKAKAAVGNKQHQKANRVGFDIIEFTSELNEVAALPPEEQIAAFANLLSRNDSLEIEQGSRRSRLLVKQDGQVVCNANRILKIAASEVEAFVELTLKEIEHGKRKSENVDTFTEQPRSGGGFDGAGSRATKNEVVDRSSSRSRPVTGRQTDTGSHRNTDTEPASDHRRQPHHQSQYRRNSAFIRGYQGGLTVRQMSAAARSAKPMIDDLRAMAADFSSFSAEPIPDLNDPFLMMKLSRLLEKSLGSRPGM